MSASSTARALLSERPIPKASRHGRKRISLIHVRGCNSRWAQTQKGKEKVSEVGHQMPRGLELDWKRKPTAPDRGQQFFTGLHRTLGPAMLLRLETIHVHRQLRRSDHI